MSLCYNCTELRNKPWVINIFGWGGDLKKTKTKGKSHQSNKRICLSEQIKCMKQNEKKNHTDILCCPQFSIKLYNLMCVSASTALNINKGGTAIFGALPGNKHPKGHPLVTAPFMDRCQTCMSFEGRGSVCMADGFWCIWSLLKNNFLQCTVMFSM